jgi:hypothetical protein
LPWLSESPAKLELDFVRDAVAGRTFLEVRRPDVCLGCSRLLLLSLGTWLSLQARSSSRPLNSRGTVVEVAAAVVDSHENRKMMVKCQK